MKRFFTRWLLMTALMVMSITTAVAQKSVLDESFESGNKPANWTAGEYWDFSVGSVRFNAPFLDGVDTLFSPMLNISSLDNKPSVAISYSLALNGDKVNELQILYRTAQNEAWSKLTTFDAATDGSVNWKGELPTGLENVQIAIVGAYKLGGETHVYRLAVENKTEAAATPTGLRIEDLTTTSTTIYWDDCKSVMFVQYNLLVSSTPLTAFDAGADIVNEKGTGWKKKYYELEDLNPNTSYYVYLQYDCGDGDVSPWAEMNFRTPCEAVSIPYAENFESGEANCCTLIGTSVSAEYPYNSTKSLKSYSAKGESNYFILPELSSAIDVKGCQISFMAAALDGGNTYARTVTIGVCTSPDGESFTAVKTLDLPKGRTWESIVVSLSGYAGTGKCVALRFGNDDKANRLFVDNIRIENATECPKPIFTEACEITSNSAKLKWKEAGNASEWNLVLSTKPLSDPEDLLGKADASKGEYAGSAATNPYTATNLLPNTTYYAYVTAGCGSSEWTSAIEFTTSKSVTIPFSENFDRFDADFYTNDVNAIPEGWLAGARGMNPNHSSDKPEYSYYDKERDVNVPFVSTAYGHGESAYKSASLKLITDLLSTTTVQNGGYVMLPAMPQTLKDLKITFWAYMPSKAGVYVRVGAAKSQTKDLDKGKQFGENITLIDSVLVTTPDVWTKYTIKLDKYTGTARYLVLNLMPTASTDNNDGAGSSVCVAYIDDISIDEIGTCGEVHNLTTETTSGSIKLTWETTSTVTNTFRVKVATKQIDPTTENGDVVANKSVTGKSFNATGLKVATDYYFYVTPACEEIWEENIATTNSTLSVPFFTDFSGEVIGKVATRGPKGWTKGNVNQTSIGTYAYVPYLTVDKSDTIANPPYGVSAPQLYFYQTNTLAQNGGYVITPELEGVDAKDVTLTFTGYYNSTSTGANYPVDNSKYGRLQIGVVSNPSDIKATSAKRVDGVQRVASVRCSAGKTPETFIVKMPAGVTGKYIVFYSDSTKTTIAGLNNYFSIDNLYIVKSSGPQVITGLSISEISQTSAKLSWTENGSATKWNVKVFTSKPNDPDVDEPFKSLTVTSKPTTITGLTHSTQYFVYVQAQVGEEKGFWASDAFWTATGTWSLPFVETFNNYEKGSDTKNTLPAYYSIAGSTSQPYVENVQSSAAGALDGLAFQLKTTTSKKISQLIFPVFNQPVKNLQLSLYAQGTGYINYQTFTLVGVMEGDNFIAIDSFMVKTKTDWYEFQFDFSKYTGSGTQIAIQQNSDASNLNKKEATYIAIDNVKISAIPDCGRVKDITFNSVSDKSAVATWQAVNGENEWRIKVSNGILKDPQTQDGNILPATTVTTNSHLLDGLYDDTDYYVYVQSKKGDNVGQWSVPTLLHTACSPLALPATWNFDNYSNNDVIPGNECISFVGDSRDLKQAAFSYKVSPPMTTQGVALAQEKVADNNYLILPLFAEEDMSKLQVSMKIRTGGTTASKKDNFEIGIMLDPTDAATFFPVPDCSESLTQQTAIYDRTYPLSKYAGDDKGRFGRYIAIHILPTTSGTTSSVGKIYIDDLCVDYIPACAKPVDVEASNIDEDGATLSWTADATDASFDVRLLASPDGDIDEPLVQQIVNGATTVDLTLNSNTQYYAFVRKICDVSTFSDWSLVYSFRTSCGTAQTLPYSDDFEAYATSKVPNCWTQYLGDGKKGGPVVSTSAKLDGANGLSVTYSTASTGTPPKQYPAGIITPKLDITSPRELTIIFDMKGSTAGAQLQIDAVKTPTSTAAEDVVTIKTFTTTTAWEKVYLKVSEVESYTSNNEFQYIRFMQPATGKTVYIDNLIISKDAIVTLPVSGLAPVAVSDTSISITFQEVTPGVESWQVAYGKHGEFDKPAKSYTGTIIDAQVYTIKGLAGNTEYDIYVRANTATAAWVGPVSAKTANAPASIPYSYDFADANENANLWSFVSRSSGNDFIIGDAAACGATGEKALYVTNDGASYAYNLKSGYAWALRDVRFSKTGNHTVSIRVKSPGNAEENQTQDALYAILVPAGSVVGGNSTSSFDYKNIYLLNGKSYQYSTGNNATDNVYRVFYQVQKEADWTTLETKVNIAQAGDYTLAFIWYNNAFGTAGKPAAIDAIEIKEYECTAVSNLKQESVASDQASFSWFAGECKNFEYVVSRYAQLNNPAGIDDADKVAYGTTDQQQILINSLEPSTNYSFYVRTLCVGEETPWEECRFRTPCESENIPYTETFAETPECWRFSNAAVTTKRYQADGSSDIEEWSVLKLGVGGYAILPEVSLPLNQINVELGLFCGTSLSGVELGVIDNILDFGSFHALAQFNAANKLSSDRDGNPYIVEIFNKMLNLYSGTSKNIVIRNSGSDAIYVKYVSLTKLPDCITPQQIEFTQVKEKQATVNWLAGTEDKWEIKVDDNDPFEVTTNPYVLTGLQQGTLYTVSMRAICDEEHKSEWSNPVTFQTVCGVYDLPLLEDFSGLKKVSKAKLTCWDNLRSDAKIEVVCAGASELQTTALETNTSYVWKANDVPAMGDYKQLLSYVVSGASGSIVPPHYRWFVSPQFKIEGKATLSFDARRCRLDGTAINPVGRFMVAISTDNGASWSMDNVTDFSAQLETEYKTLSVSLDAYAGQNIRVAFYHEAINNQKSDILHYIFIDNVRMNCTDEYPISDGACQGVDYNDNGFNIKAEDLPIAGGKDSTYYRFAANTATGCDSIVALTLTTHKPADLQPIYDTICQGEVYHFGGQSLTKSNPEGKPYYISGKTSYGCDSTIYLYLTVLESDTIKEPIQVSKLNTDSYVVDPYFTIPAKAAIGVPFDTIVKADGCNFNRYHVEINQCTEPYAFADSICDSQLSYKGYGFSIKKADMPEAGSAKSYERHAMNEIGCDSVITFSLFVVPNDTTEIDTVAVWNSELLHADYPVDEFFTIKKNTPVSAFDTVVWTVGCSYNLYHIAVKQCTRDAFYADTICANETSYVGYGFTLEAGQLPVPGNTKEFKNNDRTADECDSTTTLNLYVRPLVHNDKYITKENTELPFTTEDGLFTIKAGTPVGLFDTVVYTNVGCDYNIYHVTIEQCEEEINLPLVTICENETSYKGFGFSINADEMPAVGSTKPYVRHAMNEAGCDSVITLRLKVLENDTTSNQVTISNNELPYEVDDYYKVPADALIDTPFDTIVWTEGCSYNLYHVLVNRCTVQKKYNAEVCEGDEVYNGYGFSIEKAQWPSTGTSKDFTNVTRTADQCDSTTTLTLMVVKADTNNIDVPIDNTMLPYTVDNYYEVPATTAVGADYYELVRIDGCAFNLYHVTVAQCEKPISYNETICEDADGYVGYGFSIEKADLPAPLASKEYVRHAMDNANCDSVITLTLTAHNDTTNVPVSILITKLPFEVDEWYTVPADAQVGEQFEVVKQKGTDCAYNRYIVMVSACGSQIEYKDTVCADQTSYDGFGFSIEAADMPAPGSFKSYYRNEPKGDGCDHITFTLTVMKNDTTNVPVTILNNELPFEVDAFYTVPENTPLGSFEKVVKLGDNGCSYNKYIVTINQCTASYNFADAVCESQTSYLDNGFSIEEADMPAPGSYKDYTRHELTAQGCDSTITLRLMVTKNDTTPVPVKILNNELPFEVDAYYTVPENTPLGSFEKVVKLGDEGCSYNKYMVTINQCTASSVFTDAICESQMSYDGYGFSIEKADMPAPGFSKNFIRHETTAQGCDSTITLKLEIIPNDTAKASVTKQNTELPFVVDEYFTILAGTPVGSFDTVVVKDGCSYKRYSVTIIQETKAYSEASAVCEDATGFEGFGFSIEEADMPAAGTSKNYTRHALNEAGVDSVITFTLSVIKNDTAFINDTVFNNELPYIAQGETIVAAGVAFGNQPTKVLANNGACSYTSYSIFVEQCTASFASVDSICAGSEYSGYGFQIALADMPAPGKSKLYERHETTLEGCDSLISLTLKVMKMDTTKYAMIEIKNNQLPYEIDRYYTVPEDTPLGVHEAVVVNPEKDCAFYRYRYNIVQCSEEYKFTDMICIGSDYAGYGFVVAKADKDTVLTRTSMGAGGCDSIITLTLTVELPDTNDIVKEVLNSELPFIAQNETIVAAGAPLGIQPEVILPAGNCAYNRYIITVTQCSNSFSYKGRVCDGEGYEGFGFILPADSMPAAGESKDFFRSNRSAAGCDSLITLTLTVSKLDTIDVEKTIQKNELPFIANGDTIIAAGAAVGVQPEVIKQGNGCMYNRYIITVIACEIYADLTDEACVGSDYKEYGFDIKASEMPVAGQSKEYTRTSKDAAGCDSIITLTLTVKGDTTYLDPIEINEDQLPYQVNEFITIPAGTPVGVYEEVIQIPGDCQFIAYTVTIHEQGFGIIHITDAVESIEVYDLLGHKITTIRSDKEAKSLPTGVYMLRSIMKSGQIVNSKAALK